MQYNLVNLQFWVGRHSRICCVIMVATKERFCSDSPAAGAASEGVLANFFNSLLSKKTGTSGSPGTGAAGAGVQGSAKKTGITSNTRVHCFFCFKLSSKQVSRFSLAPCRQMHTLLRPEKVEIIVS